MAAARSSHISRLRSTATLIFGPEFDPNWFPSKFDRSSVKELETLLGLKVTPQGKKYPLLPPILFPTPAKNARDIFLNPVLVKVNIFYYYVFATRCADEL